MSDREDLGPCCACEKRGKSVRNVLMLNAKSPIRKRGWGCAVCHLPPDGALAVVCDACLTAKRELRFACRGYPGTDGRVHIKDLKGSHEHDMSKHPEEQELKSWGVEGEEERAT